MNHEIYFNFKLFISVIAASAQRIVQDYFKENKDSLMIEELINMPEPTFKPFQTTNIAE